MKNRQAYNYVPMFPIAECHCAGANDGTNIHFTIWLRAELVATGNFAGRKDLKTCSLTARNNPNFYKDYTN